MSLRSKLILRVCVGVMITIALLFIPAGSWNFWQGWVLVAIIFACGIFTSFYLYKHDPKLVERRLQTKEKIREQKLLIRLLRPFFIAVLALPGLDYRFGWSPRYFGVVPPWLILLSDAVVLASFVFVIWVLRVNSFASRTIQVESGQTVISTGPYRVVRHPMYFGSVVMLLFTPLALGSYIAVPAFALLIPFYVLRLLNEERVLREQLPGYSEYCQRTRFHLVPFVW